MSGQIESNYNAIKRFMGDTDENEALLRLYQEEADFVIGDPTEMPRYKAPKTENGGHAFGWSNARLLVIGLVNAVSGTGDPLNFITYSSKTIGEMVTSRNQENKSYFAAFKELLGNPWSWTGSSAIER